MAYCAIREKGKLIMNISEIIAQLEEELAGGKAGLFKKKIDEDKIWRLVEKIKNNLPKSLEEANYVISQKEKIIAEANAKAELILSSAEQKSKELVSENYLVKQAEETSRKVTELATKRSEQLLETTQNNVDKILKAVEDYLSEHISIVHDSREELSSTLVQLKNNLKKD